MTLLGQTSVPKWTKMVPKIRQATGPGRVRVRAKLRPIPFCVANTECVVDTELWAANIFIRLVCVCARVIHPACMRVRVRVLSVRTCMKVNLLYSTLLYNTLLYSTLPYSTLLYFSSTILYPTLLIRRTSSVTPGAISRFPAPDRP